MADIVWDASLPTEPLLDSWDETLAENRIRTQMEVGPPKIRRRSTASVKQYGVVFALTAAQVATLDDFYTSDTYNGSLAFEWTNPRTGATEDFRFLTPPKIVKRGPDSFRASFQLEVLP